MLDLDNNPYVAGTTTSTNFPTGLATFQPAKRGGRDAFIAKLNPTGTALAYATYLGGLGDDSARGIAVNEAGEVYVDGVTLSTEFPTTEGAERRSYLGNAFDGFVAKLDQSGSTLRYGTYLGGTDSDELGGIVVDRSGYAYVTGDTISMSYPVTPGAIQNAWQGSDDAFVTKLNNAGRILYSTYLGSPGPDWGRHIALNLQGDVFVSGQGGPDFLLTPQSATTIATAANGGPFVARLVPRVSRGRAALASSAQSPAYPASAAVDANFSTRWSSASTDAQWLEIDLGEHMDIDRVVLHWDLAYGRAYVLQFSDDRQTWESGTTVGSGEGGITDHTFGGFAGRYLRINLSLSGTSSGYSLWEVDVYGTPAGTRNLSPTAKIVSPADGWSFVGRTTFDIVAEAHDADGTITKVNFWLNGTVIATDLVPPYVQQLTVEDGTGSLHLAVTAEDDRGSTSGMSTITVHANPTPRGENRALGRPAFASSTESATLSAAKAVDGSGATRWSSAFSDPQWLYVDLGQPYDVKTVVLRWETAYASSFDVQVSSDAQNWRTVHRESAGSGGTQTLVTTNAVGRYVRVYGYARATGWGYSLYELELYGTPTASTATNIAKGRPAVASSTEASSYGAALATDGKTTTRWSSQFADNQWIYVDLGALYDLTRVVLRWETAFGSEYAIDVSNDRNAWRPVRTVTNGDGGVDDLDGLASYYCCLVFNYANQSGRVQMGGSQPTFSAALASGAWARGDFLRVIPQLLPLGDPRNAKKKTLLSLWQRDRERRSCIGR